MDTWDERRGLVCGSTLPMVARTPQQIESAGRGQTLSSWLRRRGCDQRTINRIAARRFTYGSYRPSDRAAQLVDCNPTLTPIADEPLEMAAAD